MSQTDPIFYMFCNMWVMVWGESCLIKHPHHHFLCFCRNQIILFPLENDNNVVCLPSGYCVLYFCFSAKIKWRSLTNYFNITQLNWFSSAIGSIHSDEAALPGFKKNDISMSHLLIFKNKISLLKLEDKTCWLIWHSKL